MEPYSGIKSIEDNFEKSLDEAIQRIGISKEDVTFIPTNGIDKSVVSHEVARMWLCGQEFVNGYKRMQALSMFPQMTSNDINTFIRVNRSFVEQYHVANSPFDNSDAFPEKILNDLLSAYVDGLWISHASKSTELKRNYTPRFV